MYRFSNVSSPQSETPYRRPWIFKKILDVDKAAVGIIKIALVALCFVGESNLLCNLG